MKIIFVENHDNKVLSYYALSFKEIYKDKMHEELMWAEIEPQPDKSVKVTWEDDYFHPIFYNDLAMAKSAVIAEHGSHKPVSNDKSYSVE